MSADQAAAVSGQLELDSTVRDVLGRARFEAFCAATGSDRRWEDQDPATRVWWAEPVECCVAPVHELLERAAGDRRRLQWTVGAIDHTLAAASEDLVDDVATARGRRWCTAGLGPWVCSRERTHPADVHAAGDGRTIRAVWAVAG